MGQLGVAELAIIGFFLVLFFGRDKIVDLARGSGEAVKEFKKGIRDDEDEDKTVEVAAKPKRKRKTTTAKKKTTAKKRTTKKS